MCSPTTSAGAPAYTGHRPGWGGVRRSSLVRSASSAASCPIALLAPGVLQVCRRTAGL